MKNILTIDFDIFMRDSIEAYNNLIEKTWKERFEIIPSLRNVSFDGESYQKLTQYLLTLFSNIDKNQVHFLREHHHILNFLDNEEIYNIVNIDHHHDWCYHKEDFHQPIVNVNCGNWVKYLNDTGHLNNYTWINNNNSQFPMEKQQFSIYHLKDCNLLNFSAFDEIYLIFSPQYVVPYYHPFFFLWMDIANNVYKMHFEMPNIITPSDSKS